MEQSTLPKENSKSEKVFTQRLDFYWKFIAVYSIALLLYLLLKGTIDGHIYTVVLLDPVVILLSVFIVGPALALLFNTYKRRTIIIGRNYIIFRNRFHSRTYTFEEVKSIAFRKQRIKRRQKTFGILKIDVVNRKRPITIRTSSFWNSKELIFELTRFKK
ncbi:MAG: hypothetical protein WCT77_01215 [Bacteroidota bacterium]|jgi:hypothetical protein